MLDGAVQGLIFVQQIAAATMLSNKDVRWIKWGYVAMLCGQPLFFFTTWRHGQWGMFALCFFYTFIAVRGYVNRRHDGEAAT